MSESNRDLQSMLGEEEAEMEKLKAEFPAGRNVKVPRSDGSISVGRVMWVEKTKKGLKILVVFEEKKEAITKFVRPEKLREANLS